MVIDELAEDFVRTALSQLELDNSGRTQLCAVAGRIRNSGRDD